MSLTTPAPTPMKEVILRFRVPPGVAARLECDARRMGLRVSEVARMRLAEAVTTEARADEPDDQAA